MRTAIVALILLISCAAVRAQHNVVSEAEYKTACGNTVPAPMRARAEGYRMTTETRSTMEGRPSSDFQSRSVINYQDRSKRHMLMESTFGTTRRVSEEIAFDGKRYVKEDSGEWVEKPAQTFDRSGAPKAPETKYLKIEYRLFPDESFRGRTVRVCEKYELATVKNSGATAETQRESTSRYWISEEGLLKSESSFRNLGENKTSTSWMRTEWDIDPTIKVTLPAAFRPQ